VELVLDYCTDYWNGTVPCRLTKRVRQTARRTQSRLLTHGMGAE
jgi:hypothetical protein